MHLWNTLALPPEGSKVVEAEEVEAFDEIDEDDCAAACDVEDPWVTTDGTDTDELALVEAEVVTVEAAASARRCTDGHERVVILVTEEERRTLEELAALSHLEAVHAVYGSESSKREPC